MRKFAIVALLGVIGSACSAQAGTLTELEITYSGQGTSGTALVYGNYVGGGEYDLTSGTLTSSTLGTQTLVVSPLNPQVVTFSNANGDNLEYDNRVFVPANSPNSPDGANLTYDGGIVFQTATPSKEDVYLSAYYQGADNPTIFYFAGWDRPNGALDSLSVNVVGSADNQVATPEPSSIVIASLGVLSLLGYNVFRLRKAIFA